MLFLIHFEIQPEQRNTVRERFRNTGIRATEGMKLIGAYHSVTQLEGWFIVEGSDSTKLWNLFQDWSDLNVHDITPVVTHEEVKKLI